MSANRSDLITQMNNASSELLREKGYISFVELLSRMGKLTQQNYEAWRHRKVPSLEKVITLNLAKIGVLLRTLHANSQQGGLQPSVTVYLSWGKGQKVPLRFSKSGDPNIERAYATHFLQKKQEVAPTGGREIAGTEESLEGRQSPLSPFRKGGKPITRESAPCINN